MMADLRSLGFKDIKTLKEVMQTKASGALQDDQTYLTERVIQVRCTEGSDERQLILCWQLVSGLPALSQKRVDLTNAFDERLH